MDDQRLTVVFMPESAAGPTNNCVGIGDVLRKRGHRVVFAAEASWKGQLEALGFEERLVDLAPTPDVPQDPGQFWKDFIRDTAPEFRKPTIEQLETVVLPIWQELIDGAKHVEPALRAVLDDVAPDVVVEDNVLSFPALMTTGAPFVRIASCNPLEIRDPQLPPVFSGLPTADDAGWDAFRSAFDHTHRPVWTDFNDWVVAQGAPPLDDLEFIHTSRFANLTLYPEVAAYPRSRPLDDTWTHLESSVRATDEPFAVPEPLRDGDGALIYLSLGSLGSADVDLMRRLVDVLGTTRHRFIVSKGPRHDEYDLADTMWGAEFLPQASVLPHVDLVITHGGNNTITESFHFGKPMIVLPLFWDQYDNAQRVHETGFGVRLDTYGFTAEQMTGAVDSLLGDTRLREDMARLGSEIRATDGTALAADAIEGAARASR